MFHYLGLLVILCTWVAGLFLLRTTHDESLQTISKHAVTSVKTSLVFGAALFIIGALFYWWLQGWLRPHLALPPVFTLLLGVTIALEISIGLFPDTSGWVQQAHRFAAYGMAVLFMPLAAIITLSAKLSDAVQFASALVLLYMFISFAALVLLRKVRRHYLFFQVMYIVAFDVIILLAGYLPTKT